MSLKRRLGNKRSPVRQFFDESFPDTRRFVKEHNDQLKGAETIRLPWDSTASNTTYGTLGMAIDYRIRYYFAVTPSKELFAWQGAKNLGLSAKLHQDFFSTLDGALERINPVGRRLEASEEGELARYCFVLGLMESAYRSVMWNPGNSPLYPLRRKGTVADCLAIPEPPLIDDLCRMSWLFYEKYRHLLSGQAVVNPTFDGSRDVDGADADLIVDGCLIDIKTDSSDNPKIDNMMLYQVLGYAVLDYSNRFQIDSVGVYLARQGLLLKWPLSELMNRLSSGKAPSLKDLRDRFQTMVAEAGPRRET